jgi:hypothetical protein
MVRLLAAAAGLVLVVVQALVWRAAGTTGRASVTALYLVHLLGLSVAVGALFALGYPQASAGGALLGFAGVVGFVSTNLPLRSRADAHRTDARPAPAAPRRPAVPRVPWTARHAHGLRQAKIAVEVAVVAIAIATLVTVVNNELNHDFDSKADQGLCRMLGQCGP